VFLRKKEEKQMNPKINTEINTGLNIKINRREWLKKSILTGGTLIGTAALGFGGMARAAEECVGLTPDQPLGPFFPENKKLDEDGDLTKVNGRLGRAMGKVIHINGKVMDQNCQPISDALIELWQADHEGKYDHSRDPNPGKRDPNFQYWARLKTNYLGEYSLKTIIPGAYPASQNWIRPPHIHFQVTKRGYKDLVTQMYFDGDPLNDQDLILKDLPKEEQKKLILTLKEENGKLNGEFHISLHKFE